MKEKNQNKSFYLIIIVLLVLLFSYKSLTQSKKLKNSIKKAQEEGLSLIDFKKENTEEKYKTTKFITADGSLSLKYSSQWSDLEEEQEEKILSFLGHPAGNYKNLISEEELNKLNESGVEIDDAYQDYLNANDITSEKPEKQNQDSSEERFKDKEFIFTKIKTPFPSLSIGLISLQELILKEEKTKEETLRLIKAELTDSSHVSEKKVEIIKIEDEENFKIIETETLLGERPVFKAKNLIFIKNNGLYVLTLGTLHEKWKSFENEFNKIITSVTFDENN